MASPQGKDDPAMLMADKLNAAGDIVGEKYITAETAEMLLGKSRVVLISEGRAGTAFTGPATQTGVRTGCRLWHGSTRKLIKEKYTMRFMFLLIAVSSVCVAIYLATNLGPESTLAEHLQLPLASLFAGMFAGTAINLYRKNRY